MKFRAAITPKSNNIGQHSTDDRSSWAKATDTATEVFAACLMMVLPGIGGYFVDKYLNTSVAFTIAGAIFGLLAGFVQIFKIIDKTNQANKKPEDRDSPDQTSDNQDTN